MSESCILFYSSEQKTKFVLFNNLNFTQPLQTQLVGEYQRFDDDSMGFFWGFRISAAKNAKSDCAGWKSKTKDCLANRQSIKQNFPFFLFFFWWPNGEQSSFFSNSTLVPSRWTITELLFDPCHVKSDTNDMTFSKLTKMTFYQDGDLDYTWLVVAILMNTQQKFRVVAFFFFRRYATFCYPLVKH